MTDREQIRSYMQAYEWGGPTSGLQLYHLHCLSRLIRPGDKVLDLACGPGPLLLELARLYPECEFIGADLSQPMLDALEETARQEGLQNVRTLREDIRCLPSIPPASIDAVISTSSLHHLPDTPSLRATFEKAREVARPTGAFYFLDFGLLRSPATRRIMVQEVARLALPVTVHDYAMSLDAAFPVDLVFQLAGDAFGTAVECRASALVDVFYFVRSPLTLQAPKPAVDSFLRTTRSRLSWSAIAEYAMLNRLQPKRRAPRAVK